MHEGIFIPLTFIMGTISWRFILATLYLPKTNHWTTEERLKPLVAVHLFRYMSLSLLIPGLTTVYGILPQVHVFRLAGGDVLTSLLSMLALIALHKEWKNAKIFVLVMSVIGLADLGLATLFDMPLLIESANKVDTRLFGVLTTFIPLVFVSHVFILKILWEGRKG